MQQFSLKITHRRHFLEVPQGEIGRFSHARCQTVRSERPFAPPRAGRTRGRALRRLVARGGQVIGASDAIGAHPKERPVSPADIHATVFAALGYDAANLHFTASDGRPMPVCEGTPISELI